MGLLPLYVPQPTTAYPALGALIGGTLNLQPVRRLWDDILRLATSIQQGTVTASLMLRKLGSYPRQNGLAVALREVGRIERTLFILDWLQDVELRRRVHAGLNKGEARNALARAVFFNRLGEIRDRSFEPQRYRASGLNLVTGGHRAVEHGLSGAGHAGPVAAGPGGRRPPAAVPLAAGLGAPQSDRRLRLAAKPQGGTGPLQAVETAPAGLAYAVLRFLRRPLLQQQHPPRLHTPRALQPVEVDATCHSLTRFISSIPTHLMAPCRLVFRT